MIHKKLLTCLFVLLTSAAIGQEYETKNFDLPKETKQAVLNEKEKKEPSVILSDKSTYEYLYNKDGDLTSYYTKYRKIRINDAADVEQFNRIYFPVSEAGDLLALRLRTVTKEGKVKEMNKSHLKKITEDENDYLILAVEGLEKDSEMEYFFTIKRGVTYFITEYAQMGVYVSRSETTIISPENLLWDARSYNGTMSRTDTVISEKRYLTMSAEATPVLDSEEKYASYNANRLRIEFKLAKNLSNNMKLFSFADAGKRYFEMMHSEEKSARKDIEKLASSLGLKKLASDDARIMALENHMKTTVNINEQESDPSIGAMLKKHYGPENQVVSLYILMFEYLNIPAELVVTTSRFDAVFDPGFETWNFLDSYLIYFPSSGKYLDPTNFLYRYGMFPYEFMGNSGLFIKRVTLGDVATSTTTVRKIDGPDSKASFDNMTAIISFSKDIKNADIQYKREFNGHADGLLRAAYFYSDEEARTKMVDDLMKSTFKDVKVTDTKVLNYDLSKGDYTKPMVIETKVSSPSLIENAGSNIIFSVGDVIGQQVEMYQDHARQNPIDANYPHRYDRLIVVNVPQGYDVKGLEKLNMNIVYDDKGIGFTSSYERNGNVVTITVQEYYNQYQLPVSAFEDFKKVINAAADFNKIKLVFSKTP